MKAKTEAKQSTYSIKWNEMKDFLLRTKRGADGSSKVSYRQYRRCQCSKQINLLKHKQEVKKEEEKD